MATPDPQNAAEAVGAALTADADMQTRAELRTATRILGVLLLVAVFAAVVVALFGLPALTIFALIGTVVVLGLLDSAVRIQFIATFVLVCLIALACKLLIRGDDDAPARSATPAEDDAAPRV